MTLRTAPVLLAAGAALAAAATLAACAGNPRPGDPDYAWNVSGAYAGTFVIDGTTYTGTLELATAPGGAVSGTMRVSQPVQVDGDLTGGVSADTLIFEVVYLVPQSGCGGTARGSGPVADGGDRVGGGMRVTDDCDGGTMLEGTFRFERAP